jgi:hypothetical protein
MLARLRPDTPFDRTEVWPFSGDDPRVADLTARLAAANLSIRRLEGIISRLERSLKEEREYDADEQLQALARRLEDSYKMIHMFQTEKSRNYSNKGIPELLKKIETVDKNMTTLMRSLRKGKNSSHVTIEQMQKDVNGFVGNLDQLVPDLINDPIYGSGRLQKNSRAKELGNLKEGDSEGNEQYMWWNSETQSNWWDGYIRNVLLLNDKEGLKKVDKHIQEVLQSQDEDGYIGIYDQELRYKFNSENGELWSKATMYRGLLAYYEFTKDVSVWNALVKAVDDVMTNYPIGTSSPYFSGNQFNGGVSHGLTFTDVLDKMYQITGDTKYTDYALFLFLDFSYLNV